jgi:trehalose 6-phosphate synthase
MSQVLVASNRGPVSFSLAGDGALTMRRGAGGLVSGLAGVTGEQGGRGGQGKGEHDVLWVCAALGEADRAASRQAPDGRLDLAGHDVGGAAVRMLDIPKATFHRAYNAVANSTLWFVHHLLYDTPSTPHFDARSRR